MLTLVFRRALEQWRLLTTVVVLIAAAASLVGVCSLLLGVTQDRAFHEEIERSQPQDVDVTAYLVDVSAQPTWSRASTGRRRAWWRDILGPMHPTVTAPPPHRCGALDGTDRLAYLMTGEALAQRADLTSGHWPADVAERSARSSGARHDRASPRPGPRRPGSARHGDRDHAESTTRSTSWWWEPSVPAPATPGRPIRCPATASTRRTATAL